MRKPSNKTTKPRILKTLATAIRKASGKPPRVVPGGLKLLARKRAEFKAVRGWLTPTDQSMFSWFLRRQNKNEPDGNLVELGVYEGKSAILIGCFLKNRETFKVCDLFDSAGGETAIGENVRSFYSSLTQKTFETNYLSVHATLPKIVRGLSSSIVNHVEPGSCRLIHVDASHQYEHVREDTASARLLLRDGGIVIFDDYRSQHTPGTAAAVWEAVVNEGLQPICVTSNKFYGTWGMPNPGRRTS